MTLCTTLLVAGMAAPSAQAEPLIFVVNSDNDVSDGTCDSTHCSLREAIIAANANAGSDSVHFSIGTGHQTIRPTEGLPIVTEAAIIDATTQPGFASTPIIELDGTLTGSAGWYGLSLDASNVTVRGFVVNRFSGEGISISGGSNNAIKGNYVGTDVTGSIDRGNTGQYGVAIRGGSSHVIGGTSAADRNVISGNDQTGIGIFNFSSQFATSDHDIIGNYIGTNAAGDASLPNGTGVRLQGNGAEGIVGTSIGGTVSGARNVISGNNLHAISIVGVGSSNVIKGNYVGVGADGTTAVPNNPASSASSPTISIAQSGVVVGGTEVGAANTIAFNRGVGVRVDSGTGVSIRGNSIHSNVTLGSGINTVHGIGIDLFPSGVTANDATDADTGANNLQNFPVITSAVRDSGNTTATGTLSSAPSSAFTVDFYSNSSCDPTGFGEGQTHLGSEIVNTNQDGLGNFNKVLTGDRYFVTTTATAADGSTSEFSGCAASTGATYPLTVTKAGAGAGTVTSSPEGISCGNDCSESFATDTLVTLTAAADGGSAFSAWSGACSGQAVTCQVTMNAVKNVTATFVPLRTLTVILAGNGVGTVTSIPGINCGEDCTEAYPEGRGVALSTTPAPGSVFAGWSGGCSGESTACSVTMSSDRSVTATFIQGYRLTVSRSGNGAGVVNSTPSGISCSPDCTQAYATGTTVTLSATAFPTPQNQNSVFAGWSGACTNETGTCEVTMSETRNVTATFVTGHLLTVTKEGTGTGTVTSSPAGISCGTDCSHAYSLNANVLLSATPAAGSAMTAWGGACSTVPANSLCQVSMSQARSVTATFGPAHLLTAATAGTGGGIITSAPGGISCGTECTRYFAEGTPVTLTAAPFDGSDFSGWDGACTNTTGACELTMSEAKSVTATFTQRTHLLTVTKTGSGSVTSATAGIGCGDDCTQLYDEGTEVTLTATPAVGSDFSGWDGACTNTTGDCEITMSEAKSVTATFIQRTHLLTVTTVGSGSVTSAAVGIDCGEDCTQIYGEGTTVSLTAAPAAGSAFTGWSGACTNATGACEVTMSEARSVTATFVALHALTVTKAGTGGGAITSAPAGISCGADCSETYLQATSVILTATPRAGSDFSGWDGACTNDTGPCEVTMSEAKSVTATFTQRTHLLTVTTFGTGSVSSAPAGIACGEDCTQLFNEGVLVTLTAKPGPGQAFIGWSGRCTNKTGVCKVTMNDVRAVGATFEPIEVHARTVSFALKRHLVAKGSVLSAGYGPCVQNIKVTIQKRGADGWRKVETTSTDKFANYSTRLPDKGGTYRAVAPLLKPNRVNKCEASQSPSASHKH